MADYVLSKRADRDFEEIALYSIRNFGEERARRYSISLRTGMETAASWPSIGRPYTTSSGVTYQRYPVGRHVLFYQPTEAGILIVMMELDRHLA